ncbi:lymphocyte antigen 75-like [Amphiura filiformis]|uniref:lymphocyte antigen 75-like n=1 Tax=Amphiura filiformis TaxID=82378 RepID=UPI003B21520D
MSVNVNVFIVWGKDSTGGCTSYPCENGGTCLETCGKPVEYFCVCQDGFRGDRCRLNDELSSSSATTSRTTTDLPVTTPALSTTSFGLSSTTASPTTETDPSATTDPATTVSDPFSTATTPPTTAVTQSTTNGYAPPVITAAGPSATTAHATTAAGPSTTGVPTTPSPVPECFMGARHGDRCYGLFDDARSWFGANSVCALLGGHLATIDGQSTQDFLASYSDNAQRWIGVFENLNHPDGPAQFENVDGTVITYENYFDVKSNFTPLSPWEICIAMDPGSSSGLWRPKRCTDETFFICEMPLYCQPIQHLCDGISPLLTWRNEELTGFINVSLPGLSCFFGFQVASPVDFHDARYVCARQGGIVATFSYTNELTALEDIVGVSARTVWIGYSRSHGNPYISEEPSSLSLFVSPCVDMGDSPGTQKCCRRDPGVNIETDCTHAQSYVMVVCKIPGPLYL